MNTEHDAVIVIVDVVSITNFSLVPSGDAVPSSLLVAMTTSERNKCLIVHPLEFGVSPIIIHRIVPFPEDPSSSH
jgi:hypothetical protein